MTYHPLGDIDGVEVQIDDVLVHGRDQVQHEDRLDQILNRLAEFKITLNKVKCEFSVSKVKVLGHIRRHSRRSREDRSH